MAHIDEPMDIDCIESNFDNKENSLQHSNVYQRTPCTEKGYEELDVTELNMKLRYSMTPTSSPMSKSYTANCVDNKNLDHGSDIHNANITRSFHSTVSKSDGMNKSMKCLPLKTISSDHFIENNSPSLLRALETTSPGIPNVTVCGAPDIVENFSSTSSSSSTCQTPEATLPTKDIPKTDGGSPIMRGLKNVLSMFRSSQSPIPPPEGGDTLKEGLSAVDSVSESNIRTQSDLNLASTPITAHKRECSLSKRSSPIKESITFNEDLEKELHWKDESTILFSEEKIPIHKLFPQHSITPRNKLNKFQEIHSPNSNLNSSVEYMDVSYNESGFKDKTITDNNQSLLGANESDSEFVDCETTITEDKDQVSEEKTTVDKPLAAMNTTIDDVQADLLNSSTLKTDVHKTVDNSFNIISDLNKTNEIPPDFKINVDNNIVELIEKTNVNEDAQFTPEINLCENAGKLVTVEFSHNNMEQISQATDTDKQIAENKEQCNSNDLSVDKENEIKLETEFNNTNVTAIVPESLASVLPIQTKSEEITSGPVINLEKVMLDNANYTFSIDPSDLNQTQSVDSIHNKTEDILRAIEMSLNSEEEEDQHCNSTSYTADVLEKMVTVNKKSNEDSFVAKNELLYSTIHNKTEDLLPTTELTVNNIEPEVIEDRCLFNTTAEVKDSLEVKTEDISKISERNFINNENTLKHSTETNVSDMTADKEFIINIAIPDLVHTDNVNVSDNFTAVDSSPNKTETVMPVSVVAKKDVEHCDEVNNVKSTDLSSCFKEISLANNIVENPLFFDMSNTAVDKMISAIKTNIVSEDFKCSDTCSKDTENVVIESKKVTFNNIFNAESGATESLEGTETTSSKQTENTIIDAFDISHESEKSTENSLKNKTFNNKTKDGTVSPIENLMNAKLLDASLANLLTTPFKEANENILPLNISLPDDEMANKTHNYTCISTFNAPSGIIESLENAEATCSKQYENVIVDAWNISHKSDKSAKTNLENSINKTFDSKTKDVTVSTTEISTEVKSLIVPLPELLTTSTTEENKNISPLHVPLPDDDDELESTSLNTVEQTTKLQSTISNSMEVDSSITENSSINKNNVIFCNITGHKIADHNVVDVEQHSSENKIQFTDDMKRDTLTVVNDIIDTAVADIENSKLSTNVDTENAVLINAKVNDEVNNSMCQSELPGSYNIQNIYNENAHETVENFATGGEKGNEIQENEVEEILLSENNSPYVSIVGKLDEGQLQETEILEKSIPPPTSPAIQSKGYNFNFDEIDNPFATKTKIRMSPTPDSPQQMSFVSPPMETKRDIDKNRRKSQPNRKKTVLPKKKLNSTYSGSANFTEEILPKSDNLSTNEMEICDKFKNNKIELKTQNTSVNKEIVPTENDVKCKDDFDKTRDIKESTIDKTPEHSASSDQSSDQSTEQNNLSPAKSNEKLTTLLEESVYHSAASSSGETSTILRNVFNIPEIDDKHFSPFASKAKLRHSPPSEKLNSTFDAHSYVNDYNRGEVEDADDSNMTWASKDTDEKDDTIREVHTDSDDTIEGPFIEADFNTDKISGLYGEDMDVVEFSDLPTQKNDNDLDGEMFIDAEAFEFLLNQNKGNGVSDSGKESLFLKFDPLFAKRMSTEGMLSALKKVQKLQSTPKKDLVIKNLDDTMDKAIAGPSTVDVTLENPNNTVEDSLDLNITVTKPMMVVTPAVNPVITPRNKSTPTNLNRRSITFTSPAIAVIDRLLSMSGNNSLMDHDTTVTHSIEHNEASLALTQLRELLAEKEIHVYNLRNETKELKDRLTGLEMQMHSLEAESGNRLKKINELNDKLTEKTKLNKSMASVVEEYERTIASLIAETEQDKKRNNEERIRLIKERDEQTTHLASMEVSFSDLHSKYEKSKQIILTCKANEDSYKASIKDFEENLSKMQSNYELLKQHASSKLNHANQELEKMNRTHESEVLKLNAMIKRKDLHITSLEETLAQKTKANDELTAICDELINKVG